jgi:Sulfotransferase domain
MLTERSALACPFCTWSNTSCRLLSTQYSLALALEDLGIPTLHTQHLYEHDDIFDMWEKEVFQPSIDAQKAELRTPDFDVLTRKGYEATMDFPMALYFEQVHERYPDCKFILTVRENSEVWFKSWDTMARSITQPTRAVGSWINNVRRLSVYFRWLFSIVNNDNSYIRESVARGEQIKPAAIASYEEHNRRVREIIPPNQLLEYSVKQGWEPLCKFLEIQDCPTTPFPRTNSARSLQVQTISAMVVPLILVLFILFYMFSAIFQRATGLTVLHWVQEKFSQAVHAIAAWGRGEKLHKAA